MNLWLRIWKLQPSRGPWRLSALMAHIVGMLCSPGGKQRCQAYFACITCMFMLHTDGGTVPVSQRKVSCWCLHPVY